MSRYPGNRAIQHPRANRRAQRNAFAGALSVLRDPEGAGSRVLRYGGTVAAVGLATLLLVPFRERIGLLNVGMVYLVVVIGATVLAGRWAGILASVLGFATFNFFLVPPYLSWEIEDLENILALFVFLGVSALISWLVAGAREQAWQAQRRADDLARLTELNQAITGARHMSDVLPAVARKVAEVFEAQACWILLPDAERRLLVQAQAPDEARPLSREEMSLAEWAFRHGSRIGQGGMDAPQFQGKPQPLRAAFMPLRARDHTIGVLAVADKISDRPFTAAERTVLSTFADQAAVAIERLSLLQEAERAEMLARTDELKSALISTVSHDLRTPLASIMAAVTSLLDNEIQWDDATRREFLQGIYDEARRLDRLVGNLLQMSRIEGGELRPEKEWYSIGEVIEAVAQRLEPRAADHPISVLVAGDLPLVMVDFSQIDQVITNLVENAIKYTSPGTPILIEARRVEDRIEVSVADRGPGVLPEHLLNLFDKFYRAAGQKTTKGLGLGLAISKGLVEAHGGTITAANRPDGGLVVTFTLPVGE